MRAEHLLSIAVALLSVVLLTDTADAQSATAAGLGGAVTSPHGGAEPVPDFSGVWTRAWRQPQLFDPPESGPGPVTADPAYPRAPGTSAPRVADLNNPILQPATRAQLEKIRERELAGDPLLKNDTLCLPLGVSAALNVFDDMQVLQTPTQVVFIYERDHQVRFVYLNSAHRRGFASSWYGDSVGHYEGDTLVIDTVGMNDKTLIDRYGTPHSDQLHIVERYRLSPDGKLLQVTVMFEDPVAFTTPWSARLDYGREPSQFEEIVCAENNRPSGVNWPIPIPTATKPDF